MGGKGSCSDGKMRKCLSKHMVFHLKLENQEEKEDYSRHGNGIFKDVELGVFQKEGQCAWSRVTCEKRVDEIGDGQGLELVGSYKGW